MKILLRACLWSAGFELLLLLPVLIANHASLGVFDVVFGILCYLALFCHAPAIWLLRHWPAAQETLIFPALVQWFLWFVMFVVIFTAIHIFRKQSSGHESHAA